MADVEFIQPQPRKSMFIVIEMGLTWMVVYHKVTKVMYAVSHSGVFTVLVNGDGTPMKYKEGDYLR